MSDHAIIIHHSAFIIPHSPLMSSEKATAIVIRTVEFSETSLVVTLFTREFGKIGALAKGARRLKGPFESALDLLALCRIVFLHKSSDALDLLTEAKLLRRFRPAGRNLDDIGRAVASRQLHDAQPVAQRVETERLGVDGDHRAETGVGGQVAPVQADGHS